MHTAMVVEDELFVRKSLITTVDWTECKIDQVYEAANGLEALELYRTHHPEIILTDIKMPVMDGMALIRAVRKEESEPRARFIIMSCLDEFNLVQEALNLGVSHYFFKLTTGRDDIQKILSRIVGELELLDDRKRVVGMRRAEELLGKNSELSESEAESLFGMMELTGEDGFSIAVMQAVQGAALSPEGIRSVLPASEKENRLLRISPQRYIAFLSGSESAPWPDQDPAVPPSFLTGCSALHHTAAEIPCALREADSALKTAYFTSRPAAVYRAEACRIPEDAAIRLLSLPEAYIHLPRRFVEDYRRRIQNLICQTYASPEMFCKALSQTVVWLSMQSDFISDRPEEMSAECISQIHAAATLSAAVGSFEAFASETLRLTSFSSQLPESIQQAILYIHAHLNQPITLNDIARVVHLNPSYLSTLFSKVMGLTLVGYVNAARIERAKVLLTHTELTIRQISLLLGFSQEIYFYRLFKKQEHVTPSEYRAQHA